MDFRNIVLGKIERNDPEYYLHQEIDVYYRYNWLIGQWFKLGRADPQVLELGCGLGWFGKIVLSTFELSSYLGIDIDNDVVEEARSRGGIHERLQYRTGDVCEIESLNLQERSYDYIVWFENLEHLQPTNFPYLINRVRRYLKSGGSLFVAVPNRIGGGGYGLLGP